MDKTKEYMEWIKYAEKDLNASEILFKTYPQPIEIICFHCQQSAEKYLKAYLIFNGIEFEKTHNLLFINKICEEIDGEFNEIARACSRLNPFSVVIRYPSNIELIEDDMKSALTDANKIKDFVMTKINR